MSCPEGMVPSVDYITCELKWPVYGPYGETGYGRHRGIWKDPIGREQFIDHIDGIICMKLKCEDLNENFFDETVDVSFFNIQF